MLLLVGCLEDVDGEVGDFFNTSKLHAVQVTPARESFKWGSLSISDSYSDSDKRTSCDKSS